jgi:hypothetical protein
MVWILDECHQPTADAQNVLLKVLEDPPKGQYVILCTTDPRKLLKTLKDRCCPVKFHLPPQPELESLVKELVAAEGSLSSADSFFASAGVPFRDLTDVDSIRELMNNVQEFLLGTFQKPIASDVPVDIRDICRIIARERDWPKVRPLLKSVMASPETTRIHMSNYMGGWLMGESKELAPVIAAALQFLTQPIEGPDKKAHLAFLVYKACALAKAVAAEKGL